MKKRSEGDRSGKPPHRGWRALAGHHPLRLGIPVFVVIALALMVWGSQRQPPQKRSQPAMAADPTNALTRANTNLTATEVAQALVVTVDLDFGGGTPRIEDALRQIERRSEPADGTGRTFAILDAWGETNANGRLRISMHLSMEKPGLGSLLFNRTGELLWKSRIVPAATGPPAQKSLTIIMDDNAGNSVMLDGTKGASRVLDVPIHNSTAIVRDLWPDGEEREFTFIYSACGCPVKAKVRRIGETTVRTTELPVMFPDDPAAMKVINSLMGWRDGAVY